MAATPTDIRSVVVTIAEQLGETESGPKGQIARIVRRLGPEAALGFLRETQEIEAQGGMPLADGSRRRTPGGVFFHIVKARISFEDRGAIFFPKSQRRRTRPPAGAEPASRPPAHVAAPLPTAAIVIGPIPNLSGEARTVKITLIGRPGPLVAKSDYIMTTMQAAKTPSLPKGLPAPPNTPTSYTVYIARKQWNTVAAALGDPDDSLIIEGYPTFDPSLEGVAVYASNVTTKALQQAKRAAQQGT
jgi:hypothetical protein